MQNLFTESKTRDEKTSLQILFIFCRMWIIKEAAP